LQKPECFTALTVDEAEGEFMASTLGWRMKQAGSAGRQEITQ
jgi:hypothetical protein